MSPAPVAPTEKAPQRPTAFHPLGFITPYSLFPVITRRGLTRNFLGPWPLLDMLLFGHPPKNKKKKEIGIDIIFSFSLFYFLLLLLLLLNVGAILFCISFETRKSQSSTIICLSLANNKIRGEKLISHHSISFTISSFTSFTSSLSSSNNHTIR